MTATPKTAEAARIMQDFAARTGLAAPGSPRRYLWTDAFALCNFLTLYRQTGDAEHRRLAVDLIDQVHDVLGRHRGDGDGRRGWISGLDDDEGRQHPTAGGLRIGKPLDERGIDEPYDDRLEWERDGQYFHYLTKWMHALRRAGDVLEEPHYCRWAIELAKAAHAGFRITDPAGGTPRLAWKMSIDLSRPLLPSTGQHDPLDAWVSYSALALCGERFEGADFPGLDAESREAADMIRGGRWHTGDALGIGGLLFDACRLLQLEAAGHTGGELTAGRLARTSLESLEAYLAAEPLRLPADHRLAFRELGLGIGLRGVTRMQAVLDAGPVPGDAELAPIVRDLGRFVGLADRLEAFWLEPQRRQARTWQEHLDINAVMLATSLVPDEFLTV